MRWILLPPAPESFAAELLDLPRPAVDALFHRGMTTADAARAYLVPEYQRDLYDPFLFSHMERAVAMGYAALEAREPILIHGDYDADGICATAILAITLRALGGRVLTFLPTRQLDGYGVSQRAVTQAIRSNVKLLITADCGISAHEVLAAAAEAGITTIIVDHHHVPDVLPRASAILHPLLPASQYPDRTLTGGGVALKLAHALLRSRQAPHVTYRAAHTPAMGWEVFEKWLLDLAAISTIADCTELVGESRAIVSFGLKALPKTLRIGLRALYETARLGERPITEDTIRFAIAPRINATGRLRDPKLSLELLMATEARRAREIAIEIEAINIERQEKTQSAMQEIATSGATQDGVSLTFAFQPHWDVGLVSLLASRLEREYGRPAAVLTRHNGELVGSLRSSDGLDCVTLLERCRPLLKRFGGHPRAAGFTLESEHLDAFRGMLQASSSGVLPKEPIVEIDGTIPLSEATPTLAGVLADFAPFGGGNSEPIFKSSDVLFGGLRRVGNTGQHLQGFLQDRTTGRELRAVGFGMGSRMDGLVGKTVDVAYHIRRDSWNGINRVQAVLRDIGSQKLSFCRS